MINKFRLHTFNSFTQTSEELVPVFTPNASNTFSQEIQGNSTNESERPIFLPPASNLPNKPNAQLRQNGKQAHFFELGIAGVAACGIYEIGIQPIVNIIGSERK